MSSTDLSLTVDTPIFRDVAMELGMNREIQIVSCIILDDLGRVLMLHRNTPTRRHWEFPGGKVNAGETTMAALVREVVEELGIIVSLGNMLGSQQLSEDGFTLSATWFAGTIVDGTPRVMEPHLHDRCDYIHPAALVQAPNISAGAKAFLSEVQNGRVVLPPVAGWGGWFG
jgi:8-oxo-dGTP diphosphatase